MDILNRYAATLREHAAQTRAEHERQRAAQTRREPKCRLDYFEIVSRWWHAQPITARIHPWQLRTITAAAFADNPRKPSIQHVAEALRRLGFTERRDWTVAGRNRRLWLPPKN